MAQGRSGELMGKSCLNCKHAKELPFGDGLLAFCTRGPPRVEVQRNGDRTSLAAFYPPIAKVPCGEYRRKWFGTLKPPAPPQSP